MPCRTNLMIGRVDIHASGTAFGMQLLKPITNGFGCSRASLAGDICGDQRLAAGDKVSKLLLSESRLDEISSDFLGIHEQTVSRSCLHSQHQRDRKVYYIRDMDTLGKRVLWTRQRTGLSQEDFAKLAGVSQSTIGNLEAGIRQTARKVVDIAAAGGVDPGWLANGKGEPIAQNVRPNLDADGFAVSEVDADAIGLRVRAANRPTTTSIRAVKIKIQAGSDGYVTEPDFDIDGGYFQVPSDVIEELGVDPSNLIITTFRGRSMEPMYFDGGKGLVDLTKTKPKENECFVVNWNGETLVKCLIKKSDGWALYSFNRDYPTISVRSGHCSIIGMVVWRESQIVKGLL